MGVSRQYCGEIGKQDNYQAVVSLSVATEQASLPMARQLYLPISWTDNPDRCRQAGVPADVDFPPSQTSLCSGVRQTVKYGIRTGIVLADATYGKRAAWR